MIFTLEPRRECHKIVIKGPAAAGGKKQDRDARTSQEPEELSYKHLIQALEIHMDSSQGHVYARIYNENAADQMEHPHCAAHPVRACAVEMHTDISEGNFYARIYNEKNGDQRAYPDLNLAIHNYSKNPSVWTH